MNLLQIQQECGRLLNDPSNSRWSTDVLTSRINEAQIEIQGYTNAVKTRESISVVSGTGSYSPNASTMDVLFIYKVFTDGTAEPLKGITREELDYLHPDWNNWSNGEPLFFIYNASLQQIALIPTPDSSVTTLSVYESRQPASLVNPTDVPFDSNNQMIPYNMSIIHWVVAQCWMDDGTPESLGKAKFHKSGDMLRPGQFELQLARITATFDVPEVIPSHILFKPQGGRLGSLFIPNKSNPFDF